MGRSPDHPTGSRNYQPNYDPAMGGSANSSLVWTLWLAGDLRSLKWAGSGDPPTTRVDPPTTWGGRVGRPAHNMWGGLRHWLLWSCLLWGGLPNALVVGRFPERAGCRGLPTAPTIWAQQQSSTNNAIACSSLRFPAQRLRWQFTEQLFIPPGQSAECPLSVRRKNAANGVVKGVGIY